MDLLQKHVTHNTFGDGTIIEKADNIITVKFGGEIGSKQFIYPEGFEHFLVIQDPDLKAGIGHDLKIKLKKNKEEKLLREQRKHEEAEKRRAQGLAEVKASLRKKAGTKKATTSKKVEKKATQKV